MAGPSGRKDGLRCDCGKLLLENDPAMGLGVRCGRRECDKFHPLEELQRAAKFEKQKENPKEEKVAISKTEILNNLIALGVHSGDPQQSAISRYVESLNFDIDRVEKTLGFPLMVRQFANVEFALLSKRIDGATIKISINLFDTSPVIKENFHLSVCTFKNESYEHQFFGCNGRLQAVKYHDAMDLVYFLVENEQGTDTIVELHRDHMMVAIVGRDKHPNLQIAAFYIDKLSPVLI